jgi:hypothetical protein
VLDSVNNIPLVKGAILSQAFPDPEWKIAQLYNLPSPLELIEPDYPPILMLYSTKPGQIADIHDPINGINMLEEFACQGVPAALEHSTGNGVFSPENRPQLFEFISNPLEYINSLNQSIIQGSDSTEVAVLLAPKDVQLEYNPVNPHNFRLTWKENEWSALDSNPAQLKCEMRARPSYQDDWCGTYLSFPVYSSTGSAIPIQFNFPNVFMNPCNLPASIEPGSEYDIELKCQVRIPGYDYFGSSTPWSETATVFIPPCNDSQNPEHELGNSYLQKITSNSFLISHESGKSMDYHLFDQIGRILDQGKANSNLNINLDQYNPGIYYLVVQSGTNPPKEYSLFRD